MKEKQSAVDPIAPLSNQIAVVTGAARGIGEAIALKLASLGAAVVLTARDRARLAQVKADIEQRGGNVDRRAGCDRRVHPPAIFVEPDARNGDAAFGQDFWRAPRAPLPPSHARRRSAHAVRARRCRVAVSWCRG